MNIRTATICLLCALAPTLALAQSATVNGIPGQGISALVTTGGGFFQGGVNAQTGTTYTVVASDENKLLTFSNASAVAVALPQATTTGFTSGAVFSLFNKGAGTVTITPTTSTINGATTLTLTSGNGVDIYSDGTNYQVQQNASSGGSGLPTGATGQTVYYSGTNTGAATSAVTLNSAGTTGQIGLNNTSPLLQIDSVGSEAHLLGGAAAATTTSASCASGTTSSCALTSTTGYPTTGGYVLVLSSGGGVNEYIKFTGVSGNTITGLTRGVWGSTAQNLGSGQNVYLVVSYRTQSNSVVPYEITLSTGDVIMNAQSLTGSFMNNIGPSGDQTFFSNGLYTSQIYFPGAHVPYLQGNSGTRVQVWDSPDTGNPSYMVDNFGVTASLNGTIAVTGSTATIAPVDGVSVLTGTIPTSGTLTTMTVPTTGACAYSSAYSCSLTIINTASASLTTGSGTSAGNFAAAYTLPVKSSMVCTEYGTTALWYCSR